MKKFSSLLSIKSGEGRISSLVIGIMFITAMGAAFGGTSIEALFFARFGVDYLPYMFIGLGVTNMLTSLPYHCCPWTNSQTNYIHYHSGVDCAPFGRRALSLAHEIELALSRVLAWQGSWRAFNYVFVVVYPNEKEGEVMSLLGPLADEQQAARQALEVARSEAQSLSDIDQFFAWFNVGRSHVALPMQASPTTMPSIYMPISTWKIQSVPIA